MPRAERLSSEHESIDRHWMRHALGLARQSVGVASPNPAVGCVIVKDGQLVGQGFHNYDRLDHAEIVALKEAGGLARGATAYVTLEPCNHFGRTGPCVDALLRAGVKRVVAATEDPNPAAHGKGIESLRAAGVQVESGILQTAARNLNDAFAKYIQTSLPLVVMKIASTLDGRIAPAGQKPKSPYRITGTEARARVQVLRHAADALLTGVGTILADDPLLTDRSNLPRRVPLLRVVLDSMLRIPLNSKLIETAQDDVLIFFTEGEPATRRKLERAGIRLEQLPAEAGGNRVALSQAMNRLGKMQISSVLVEAGAEVNAAMLERDLVDKLILIYAPIFLGPDAIPMLASARHIPP